MKKTVKYFIYKKVNDRPKQDLVGSGETPLTFTDIESLKDKNVMSILFWRDEVDDNDKRTIFKSELEKKYIIGKVLNYNDVPKTADFNSLNCELYNQNEFVTKNPRCALTKQNVVILLERCAGVPIDSCEIEVIDPADLDNIKEITAQGIVYLNNKTL